MSEKEQDKDLPTVPYGFKAPPRFEKHFWGRNATSPLGEPSKMAREIEERRKEEAPPAPTP